LIITRLHYERKKKSAFSSNTYTGLFKNPVQTADHIGLWKKVISHDTAKMHFCGKLEYPLTLISE